MDTLLRSNLILETTRSSHSHRAASTNRKLKDDFLSNTSHELRTPLNGIIGIAESLIDGATGELPPETRLNLTMISQSGKRLGNLVNDRAQFTGGYFAEDGFFQRCTADAH